jgi:hypothetical protein
VGKREAFSNKGSQDTINPFNNRARKNKLGEPIYLDGKEN